MKERNRNFIALNLPFENEKIAEDSNVVAWKTERLWLMAIDKKVVCGMERVVNRFCKRSFFVSFSKTIVSFSEKNDRF